MNESKVLEDATHPGQYHSDYIKKGEIWRYLRPWKFAFF